MPESKFQEVFQKILCFCVFAFDFSCGGSFQFLREKKPIISMLLIMKKDQDSYPRIQDK